MCYAAARLRIARRAKLLSKPGQWSHKKKTLSHAWERVDIAKSRASLLLQVNDDILTLCAYAVLTTPDANTTADVVVRSTTMMIAV